MTLNSAEQREHTQLQQQIAAYRKRHDQFAEVIANAATLGKVSRAQPAANI
ncbi:hypothetical protein [Methylomonas rapida]|uniref:Uncharacterized protein n=1 Tax=Methylomonas rapida TaxID=2963939 RepID=A0ABY7GJK3_9GAMM|nr:hypothetical protein [Methylomonas rapida]WAR44710.1 hypothetical protein NM686_020605 [Methylomonas rapida]